MNVRDKKYPSNVELEPPQTRTPSPQTNREKQEVTDVWTIIMCVVLFLIFCTILICIGLFPLSVIVFAIFGIIAIIAGLEG